MLHFILDESMDPFWPALHCFMVILDRLGSKVWGQLIDPIEAFQTIINNVSYNREIQNIRNSSIRLVKCQNVKITHCTLIYQGDLFSSFSCNPSFQ